MTENDRVYINEISSNMSYLPYLGKGNPGTISLASLLHAALGGLLKGLLGFI